MLLHLHLTGEIVSASSIFSGKIMSQRQFDCHLVEVLVIWKKYLPQTGIMRVGWLYHLHCTGILRDRPLCTIIMCLFYRRFLATVPKLSGIMKTQWGHLLPHYTGIQKLLLPRVKGTPIYCSWCGTEAVQRSLLKDTVQTARTGRKILWCSSIDSLARKLHV